MKNHNPKSKNVTECAILATLAYYDLIDMPLTAHEIHLYLITFDKEFPIPNSQLPINNVKFIDIVEILNELYKQKKVGEKWGYYFLPGREELVQERIRRMKIADQKWKKTRRAVRWLQAVPFLEAVYASGSLVIGNTKKDSDLDVLLITKAGRMFTARFFVIAILWVLRAYRHGTHVADRVCPNHFITTASLAIPFHSVYTAYLYANLIPLFSRGQEITRQFYAANDWMGEYITNPKSKIQNPNVRIEMQNQRTLHSNIFLTVIAHIGEAALNTPVGDFFERVLRNLQLARIRRNRTTKDPGAGHVVADDGMLAFHPHSPESRLIDEFRKRCHHLFVA